MKKLKKYNSGSGLALNFRLAVQSLEEKPVGPVIFCDLNIPSILPKDVETAVLVS